MFDTQNTHNLGRALEVNVANHREISVDPFVHAPAHVGMEMSLEIKSPGDPNKIVTQLVGFLRGNYIIVSTPRLTNGTINFSNGRNQVIVRYLLDGTVFGFQSLVLRTIGAPFHLTFLKYPEKIEEISLRRTPRVQVVIPIRRENSGEGRECIMNLSTMGALLQLSRPVTLDDTFTITFTLPDGGELADVPCSVKRVEITRDRVLAGVQFEKEGPDLSAIERYLEVVRETLG
jgi:hypothetical protein